MLSFLACIFMVIAFVLSCTTTSRVMPMFIAQDGYSIHGIAAILIAKAIGNSFALVNFKSLFEKFGTFRLLTISIVAIVQCMLLVFNFINTHIYVLVFFFFGFFEQCAGLIIKPIVGEFIKKYKRQFEMLLDNFIRFLSGFLLILDYKYIGIFVVSLVTITLIPYAMSEARNLFRKDYVQAYDSHLLFIFSHYNEYFVSAFLHNLSSFITNAYLFLFLKSLSLAKAATYISIYLWGQFVFSLPFSFLVNWLNIKKHIITINLIVILSNSIAIIAFWHDYSLTWMGINVWKAVGIALLGGSFSLSFKNYFRTIKKKEHDDVPVDMTEDQIKGIAALFGVVLGLTIIQIHHQIALFVAIILINGMNIAHVIARRVMKKLF